MHQPEDIRKHFVYQIDKKVLDKKIIRYNSICLSYAQAE